MAQHTVESLKTYINSMDSLSYEAFTTIKAIAKLALHALETPSGASDLTSLGFALQAIAARADDGMDCIGAEAENAGEGYTDDAAARRFAVWCDARRSIEALAVSRALAGRV